MAETLELKGGDLFTPRSLYDVMDLVEEFMGCEVRQYLEGYMDGTVEEPDEEYTVEEHQGDVLTNILYKVDDVDMEMQRSRIDRQAVEMHLNAIRRMIKRELQV